jgi:DNA (cytosine-5)-methyltransferase 1
VPELKRLQGFPDDFKLAGSRRDIQLQIGNSVPPLLVTRIAEAIRDQLTSGEITGMGSGRQVPLAA